MICIEFFIMTACLIAGNSIIQLPENQLILLKLKNTGFSMIFINFFVKRER